MSDMTPKKHQRITSVGERATLYDWLLFIIVLMMFVIMSFMGLFTSEETFIYWIIFGVGLCCLWHVIRKLMVAVIARDITSPTDFENGLDMYMERSPILQQIMAEQHDQSVENHLLRPSQEPQDDNRLLRPAADTETTPQDQLLRPADDKPNP